MGSEPVRERLRVLEPLVRLSQGGRCRWTGERRVCCGGGVVEGVVCRRFEYVLG